MPTNKEEQALIRIAGRLDKKAVTAAQIVARKTIRAQARAARIDSDGTRRGVTLSYRGELERLRNERREIAAGFKATLTQSDKDIAAGFAAKREDQATAKLLAMNIAAEDARSGLRGPAVV
jgi:hypothetical protein